MFVWMTYDISHIKSRTGNERRGVDGIAGHHVYRRRTNIVHDNILFCFCFLPYGRFVFFVLRFQRFFIFYYYYTFNLYNWTRKNVLFAKVFISFIVCLACVYVHSVRRIECLCSACVYSNNIIVRFSTAQQMNIMCIILVYYSPAI